MANEINILGSDTFIDPPELGTFSKGAIAAYGAQQLGKRAVGSLLDTQGYGVNSPVPKYETKVGKFTQMWRNALQASGTQTQAGAVKEIAKSVITGNPIELAAAESSIKEVKEILKDPNLSPSEREKYTLEDKSRTKNIRQRKGLLANHKRSLGQNVRFKVPSDYKPSTFVVDEQVARLDPSMKNKVGQTVEATEHVGKQRNMFKSMLVMTLGFLM